MTTGISSGILRNPPTMRRHLGSVLDEDATLSSRKQPEELPGHQHCLLTEWWTKMPTVTILGRSVRLCRTRKLRPAGSLLPASFALQSLRILGAQLSRPLVLALEAGYR